MLTGLAAIHAVLRIGPRANTPETSRRAAALADIHERLEPYYSEIGRPSVDPELMLRMLIIGYCYGLRSERMTPACKLVQPDH